MWPFKNKKNNVPVEIPEPLGWLAIEEAFKAIYPDQRGRHLAPPGLYRMHDKRIPPENPFDGISVFDGNDFWHYVTFGMSDLYEKTSADEKSGFGFEFTFRVAKNSSQADPPFWPVDLMISLAQRQFVDWHFSIGQTINTGPIIPGTDTQISALLIINDPSFDTLQTPFGTVTFFLLTGIEQSYRIKCHESGYEAVLEELRIQNPKFITPYNAP